ncbi:UNVERIFIED_CONTAM: hypothetical protein FKN15_013424 [Acipenser sinensis]
MLYLIYGDRVHITNEKILQDCFSVTSENTTGLLLCNICSENTKGLLLCNI